MKENSESGNHIEWVVSSGSGLCILGTSLTTIFVSLSIKVGIKLCVIELKNKALWHTSRYVLPDNGQLYKILHQQWDHNLLDDMNIELDALISSVGATAASKPTGVTAKHLSKVWRIDTKTAKKTLEVTKQLLC